MKTLLILRHAKSSWKDASLSDHDRPLNKRGKRDAPRVGRLIQQQALVPDLVVSSTAKRARGTAKRVAKACGYTGEIRLTPHFYHAPAGIYIEVLNHLSDDYSRVMVVGHNPGMEELVARLGRHCAMPTAALANVSLPIDKWSELDGATKGKLVDVWYPRDLL